ncbi:MAG TPA: hypothetical protein VIG95_01900, partial [Gemmatimonadales bacterium]
EQLRVAAQGLCRRVTTLLGRLGFPTRSPEPLNGPGLITAMLGDKKNRDGVIHVALVAQLGRMHHAQGWTTPVSSTTINQAIDSIS